MLHYSYYREGSLYWWMSLANRRLYFSDPFCILYFYSTCVFNIAPRCSCIIWQWICSRCRVIWGFPLVVLFLVIWYSGKIIMQPCWTYKEWITESLWISNVIRSKKSLIIFIFVLISVQVKHLNKAKLFDLAKSASAPFKNLRQSSDYDLYFGRWISGSDWEVNQHSANVTSLPPLRNVYWVSEVIIGC